MCHLMVLLTGSAGYGVRLQLRPGNKLSMGLSKSRAIFLSTKQRPSRSTKQATKDYEYCVSIVRNRDRESYLCGLLMPRSSRRAYFAIRAFNAELASVKEGRGNRRGGMGQSEEPGPSMALKMRLQWWNEALNNIYQDETPSSVAEQIPDSMRLSWWSNPVVRELDTAVRQHQLTRRFLERLLESRESDLDMHQLYTMDEALGYAENTFSSLLYLSLECAGVREEEADMVAHHAGLGVGVTMNLRSARIRWSRGENSIPRELLPPTDFPYDKLSGPEADISEVEKARLREAVRYMSSVASSHLAYTRAKQTLVPSQARACLLPVIPAMHFLSVLQVAQYEIFDPRLSESNNLKVLLLMGRAWLTGIF